MKRIAILALALAACSPATNTIALDDRHAIIEGRGNAFVSMGDVQQSILRQAAEATIARGYTHFAILGETDQSTTSFWQSPTQTNSSATASCFGYTCSGYGSSTTYGGQTYQFDRPGADVMIRFFNEGEFDSTKGGIWDARSILETAAEN